MTLESAASLIEAIAKLLASIAWPLVAVFALTVLGPPAGRFLASLSEFRLKGGGGFEAAAMRRLDIDATSQRLQDFWKPGGKIDRRNAALIATAMQELGIAGSVA